MISEPSCTTRMGSAEPAAGAISDALSDSAVVRLTIVSGERALRHAESEAAQFVELMKLSRSVSCVVGDRNP